MESILYDIRTCGHEIVNTPCHECLLDKERERVRVLRGVIARLAGAASRVSLHHSSKHVDEMNDALLRPEIAEIMDALGRDALQATAQGEG